MFKCKRLYFFISKCIDKNTYKKKCNYKEEILKLQNKYQELKDEELILIKMQLNEKKMVLEKNNKVELSIPMLFSYVAVVSTLGGTYIINLPNAMLSAVLEGISNNKDELTKEQYTEMIIVSFKEFAETPLEPLKKVFFILAISMLIAIAFVAIFNHYKTTKLIIISKRIEAIDRTLESRKQIGLNTKENIKLTANVDREFFDNANKDIPLKISGMIFFLISILLFKKHRKLPNVGQCYENSHGSSGNGRSF